MGTEAGTPFNRHGQNLGELKHLVEVGFSPLETLESGTRIAAKMLGLEKEMGTIEEGKLADLIVVGSVPVEEIETLCKAETIHLIMQGGKWVKGREE